MLRHVISLKGKAPSWPYIDADTLHSVLFIQCELTAGSRSGPGLIPFWFFCSRMTACVLLYGYAINKQKKLLLIIFFLF